MIFLKKFIQAFQLTIAWDYIMLRKWDILYIFRKYYNLIFNKKVINFLWTRFFYDTRFMPLFLPHHLVEISVLDKFINIKEIKTVFDIWANAWQFSCVLSKEYPNLQLFCFEPNKIVFELLEKNKSSNMVTYNFWVWSKNESRKFFFTEGKTSQGSVYESNASLWVLWGGNIITTEVNLVTLNNDNIKKYLLPDFVDLVKIDVEWFEKDVLSGISNLDYKYLYIEASHNRQWSLSKDDIVILLKSQDKDVRVIYQSPFRWQVYDLILEVKWLK